MSLADLQWCPTSVQVTVLQARGLRIKGKSGTNDAYALMQVGKEKFQTSVVEKSVAPVWKEEAAFDLPPLLPLGGGGGGGTERCTLHVQVLHRALMGPDKLLGQAVINLLQLSEDKTRDKTKWFKLLDKTGKADKDRGEVLVDIQFMRNNMTASMFDLSAAGKSRSRLGKFKDKVRGKKKESDTASILVPSFTQVLTDSEEEGNQDAEEDADTGEKKKKHKMKSLFSTKSNLQRNMSQSMSVLPAKNSSLSGSQSSGLNVDSSEGKKKFKFLIHKRSGSSDSKDSSSGHQKHGTAEQSNLCINGSHVYCEEQPPRTSRIGSNFSLASSGHGSMEDVPESSPPSVDSLRAVRQYSPWTEEEEEEEEGEHIKEDVGELRREEEERIKRQEKELERLAEEKKKRQEEEEKRTEEEKVKREEEERIRRQEEERAQEKERVRREDERERLAKEKKRLEEQQEEKVRKEEEERIRREERVDEERRKREEEERVRRQEEEREEKRRLEEQERRRREEEERIRMEEERAQEERRHEDVERARRQEEQRKLAEEKRRMEEEEMIEKERVRKEEEERIRREEEMAEEERRRREEEEMVRIQKEEREEKRRLEEQERRRREEEERIKKEDEEKARREKEDYERLVEKMKLEEEERKTIEAEEKMRQEERIRVEEETRKKEEERVRRQEVEREKSAEKKRIEEQERRRIEEEEKREEEERIRMEDRRKEEEETARKEKEEHERLVEEKNRQEEQERRRIEEEEKIKKEEEKRIRMEEEAEKERTEEEARKLEIEKLIREAEEQKDNQTKLNALGKKPKVAVESPAGITSNPFDENFSNNPFEKLPDSPAGLDSNTAKGSTTQQRVQSAASLVGSKPFSTDEKNLISTQRERRLAPQPPGRNPAERQAQGEQHGSTPHLAQINKSKAKDIKTVLPQRSVQMIAPLSRSPTDTKNTQSMMQSSSTKETSNGAKHSKRPAPSRPRSVEEGPSSEHNAALSSDGNISHECGSEAKQFPIVYGLNPFEDDEDENVAQDDATTSGNTGSVQWPPVVSQAADKDAASQVKIKSPKARAPPLPVTIPDNSACDPESEAISPVHVQEAPLQESQPAAVQSAGEEASGKKEGPPITSRRLQPVKPLNPMKQQSISVVPGENDNKSTGILCQVQEKKVKDTGLKGPYSQLTREELISLVLKQETQLSDKDKKISELEQYIDNLLVRVIEEKPSILMSLNSLKKAA
ncbi:trichohyalin isoform X2 [Sander lucioperca]|uniref:trichohyalin isoform X2 n=1 Tax=Sander lucioperca TaxID=283035 RepID=UPI00125E9009|nr:trichohyalin isoform X2 [Sander lucioperca]